MRYKRILLIGLVLTSCTPLRNHIAKQHRLYGEWVDNQKRYAAERHALDSNTHNLKTYKQ
jgi:hypothetical protein